MKKLTSLFLFSCAVTILSCNSGTGNDSKSEADSINQANADATQTSATAAANMEEDSKFAVEAANGGMAEVELSKLAQQKSTNAKVKEFAAMMIADHSKANEELKALAAAKNITLPATPGEDKQKALQELSAKSGADFDKAYVSTMVSDHKSTVQLFEDARTRVTDPEMKQFVEKTLPVLKMHLEHIEAIEKQIK